MTESALDHNCTHIRAYSLLRTAALATGAMPPPAHTAASRWPRAHPPPSLPPPDRLSNLGSSVPASNVNVNLLPCDAHGATDVIASQSSGWSMFSRVATPARYPELNRFHMQISFAICPGSASTVESTPTRAREFTPRPPLPSAMLRTPAFRRPPGVRGRLGDPAGRDAVYESPASAVMAEVTASAL